MTVGMCCTGMRRVWLQLQKLFTQDRYEVCSAMLYTRKMSRLDKRACQSLVDPFRPYCVQVLLQVIPAMRMLDIQLQGSHSIWVPHYCSLTAVMCTTTWHKAVQQYLTTQGNLHAQSHAAWLARKLQFETKHTVEQMVIATTMATLASSVPTTKNLQGHLN